MAAPPQLVRRKSQPLHVHHLHLFSLLNMSTFESVRSYASSFGAYVVDHRHLVCWSVAGAVAAPIATSAAISAAGFSAAGVAAGSVAASVQGAVYGGATAGVFSALQSFGVLGVPAAVNVALGALGATIGGIFGRNQERQRHDGGEDGVPAQ